MELDTSLVYIIILIDKLSVIGSYKHVQYETIWTFVKTEIVKNL